MHYLWIQERVANGDIRVTKVWGGINPADMLTKYIDSKLLTQHMSTFGIEYLDGRAAGAPAVACLTPSRSTAGPRAASVQCGLREPAEGAVATKRVRMMSPIATIFHYEPN